MTQPWVVLVGGEHWKTVSGERWLGQHCSLEHVGEAYSQCVERFGRERIITMCQLTETLEWLENAGRTGLPLWSPQMSRDSSAECWRQKLATVTQSCQRLLDDGGADYDREHVNAHTFMQVLTGRPTCADNTKVVNTPFDFRLRFLHIHWRGSDFRLYR